MDKHTTMKVCTGCGKEESRSNILVVKVAFHRLGEPSTQLRSRNTDWLCPECCTARPEWNLKRRGKTKTSGIDILCDTCGGFFPRSEIMVSKIIFYPLSDTRLTIRSRTLSWQCYHLLDTETKTVDPAYCLAKDPVWNLEGYRSSPGWKETDQGERS